MASNNTFFTVKDREKRWSNIFEAHELYCSGHFMEAAVAYYDATGKDSLLRIMEKNVEHIYDIFIVGGHKGDIKGVTAPCGVCRQVMSEFCSPDFKVILVTSNDGDYIEETLGSLLPYMFKL